MLRWEGPEKKTQVGYINLLEFSDVSQKCPRYHGMFAVAPLKCFHLQEREISFELKEKLNLKEIILSGIHIWGSYENQSNRAGMNTQTGQLPRRKETLVEMTKGIR